MGGIRSAWSLNAGVNYNSAVSVTVTGAVGTARAGTSAALSGDGMTAFVGGPNDNSNRGAVWALKYDIPTANYVQFGSKLVPTASAAGSLVGTSVATDGTGTWMVTCGPADSTNIGACWVYRLVAGVYTEHVRLRGSDYTGTPQMGNSVSMNAYGTTIIMGAENGNTFWVFNRQDLAWFQAGTKVTVPGMIAANPGVGASVSMDALGCTLAIGAEYEGAVGDGAVIMYS